MKGIILFSVCLCSALPLIAQDTLYCDPRIDGQARAKGIVFSYDRTLDHELRGSSEVDGLADVNTEVRRNRRWFGSIRVPIILKDGLQILAGYKRSEEAYSFDEDALRDDVVVSDIDDQTLSRSSFSLYVLKPQKGNRWLFAKGSLALNQNPKTLEGVSSFFKYSVTALYGVKRSSRLSYGFGVSGNYLFGRATILPVFMYNRTFNRKWGIELNLPAKAVLRHNMNDRRLAYWVNRFVGDNYDVDLTIGNRRDTYFLERTEFHTYLRLEQEIHDWLWFGLDAGIRFGYNLDVVNGFGADRGELFITGSVDPAPRFSLSIFMVVPKAWSR